jgi:Zn-dependent protease with chaperone function
MTNDAQGGKQPPRLNPFAFPADTDFRFVLMIALVLGSSLYIYYQLSSSIFGQQLMLASQCKPGVSFTDCAAPYIRVVVWWLIGGVMLVLAVAGGIYLLVPMWKLWRNKLVPLTVEDAPEMVTYLANLCHEVGLVKPPVFVLNPLGSGTNGLAFGRLGQYYVVLSGGLVILFTTDQAAFRAILLHELAHLVNEDVNKTYFTVAIWWAFVAVALVPFIVTSMITLVNYPGEFLLIGNEAWRILALSVVVYLTRNAVLRAREIYADVRASTWDGPSGALTRVLASLPRSRGRWKAVLDVHPNPEERFRTVYETHRLFRIGFWEAFGVGIAIGIALPIMQLFLLFVASILDFQTGVTFQTFGPALIFAPLAAGVVGLGIWRATFAARAREKAPTGVGRVGLCLGLGIMLGTFLSFSNYFEPNSLNFNIVFVYGLPWNVLLLIGLFFLSRWIAASASAWLDIATTGRSLRLIYTVGLLVASMVLVIWLAQLASFNHESEFIREGGLAAFDPVLVWLALPARFLNALMQPETLLALISLWAFPLAAWFWRGRVRKATGSDWAFLDSSFQRLQWSHQEPLSPRFALTLGLLVGFVFCVLLLVVRVGLRLGVSEAIRQTVQYKLVFYSSQVVLALLLQVGLAAIVAGKVRRLGSLHGVFAVFVGGCVITLGVLDLNLLFGGGIDLSISWQTFCFVVNGGALLALPVAIGVSVVVARARQIRREGATFNEVSGTPGFASTIFTNVPSPRAPAYQPTPLAQSPYANYPEAPYQAQDYQPPTVYAPPARYSHMSPDSPLYSAREVPQKKSNRFLWIALGIVTGLLVLLCAYSVFFYVTPPTPTPANAISSTPTTILNTYCTALKKGDYHTAYKQLSSGIQSQRTEAEFASIHTTAFVANGGLSYCVISNIIVKDQLAGGVMTWITGNGMRAIYDCVLIDPGDGWKIVSLTSQH